MDAQTERQHVLILGGTKEARQLAEALAAAEPLNVTYALHAPTGTVQAPKNCTLHVGSFGGKDGLLAFIDAQHVSVLVNALHPHAKVMQERFEALSGALALPTYSLHRPLWSAQSGDQWRHFSDVEDLIGAVQRAGLATLFCAVGPQSMQAFAALTDAATVYARRFDVSRGADNGAIRWIDALPHPSQDAEIKLLKALGIQALVTKNSGGDRPAKLDAAKHLGLPVFLLDPPGRPKGGFDDWQDLRDALLRRV